MPNAKCPECGRVFDLTDKQDAQEWAYGHDCEALVGKRVELISTTDPLSRLQPGDRGVIRRVDDRGTVHVTWDNGGSLGLIPGTDQWKEVT